MPVASLWPLLKMLRGDSKSRSLFGGVLTRSRFAEKLSPRVGGCDELRARCGTPVGGATIWPLWLRPPARGRSSETGETRSTRFGRLRQPSPRRFDDDERKTSRCPFAGGRLPPSMRRVSVLLLTRSFSVSQSGRVHRCCCSSREPRCPSPPPDSLTSVSVVNGVHVVARLYEKFFVVAIFSRTSFGSSRFVSTFKSISCQFSLCSL